MSVITETALFSLSSYCCSSDYKTSQSLSDATCSYAAFYAPVI